MSVNEAWQGKLYKTKTYKAYEKEVYFKLPKIDVPEGKISIILEFGVSNRQADWDNPIKPFIDILQWKYGFNDSQIYEASVTKKIVKKGEEYTAFYINPLLKLRQ